MTEVKEVEVVDKVEEIEQAEDLQILHDFRLKYPRNSLIVYLNINSLWNKIIDLMEIISYLQLDYFVLSETKINNSFPFAQFDMSGYEIRARRDRDEIIESIYSELVI